MRVAIIGGGAVGLASAWHILAADPTVDVTVLEADHVGSGSTSRSVGVVETQYIDAFEVEVRAYGRRFFDMLAADHGLRFVRTGYLRLASQPDDFQAYETSLTNQQACGVTDARVLTAEDIERMVPQMSMVGRLGGLWGPSDGFADGHLYCTLLTELISARGGAVRQNTRVTAARDTGSQMVLITERGEVAADVVVNAAGGWAGQVGELVGAPVPLVPQVHSAALVEMSQPLPNMMPMVMDYVPGSGQAGLYFRFERPDQLVAGLHIEEPVDGAADPDTYPQTPGEDFLEELASQLAVRLPGLPDGGIRRTWSGIYPMTTDHAPIVGWHPGAPRVIDALGAGGNGIQLSPAMGRAVAECLVAGAPTSLPTDNPWDSARVGR